MTRKALRTLSLLISAVLLCLIPPAALCAEGRGLKAGVILPLSGDFAPIGSAIRQGLELAMSDYTQARIELVIEDDRTFDRTAAATAVHKLVDVDRVDVLLNAAMNTVDVIAPILARRQTPGVVLWDSNRKIRGCEGIYGMGFSTEGAGADMADFAYEQLGLRRVAVVIAEDEWSEMISEAFSEKLISLGGEVVMSERTAVAESDFKSLVARMRSLRVDAVYAPLFTDALAALLRQARSGGLEARMLTGDGLIETAVRAAGAAAEGVYATQAWANQKSAFAERFAGRIDSTDSVNLAFAGIGYDAGRLLIELARETTGTRTGSTRAAIAVRLPDVRFEGIGGPISFGPGRIADRRETIVTVKNARLAPVAQ